MSLQQPRVSSSQVPEQPGSEVPTKMARQPQERPSWWSWAREGPLPPPPIRSSPWTLPATKWKHCCSPAGRRSCSSAPGPAGTGLLRAGLPHRRAPSTRGLGEALAIFPGWPGAPATHLRQLKPDGSRVLRGAVVEFQARRPLCLPGAQQVEPLQVPQGDGAVQSLGAGKTAELGPSWEGRGPCGWRERSGPRVPRRHGGRSPAHLGAGVHDDQLLAVQPQEDRAWQSQLAHPEHHVDRVAEEGQLADGLWEGRGWDRSSGHWGPGSCPARPPPSPFPVAPGSLMKPICASLGLCPRSCLSSWPVRFLMVARFTCQGSDFGK